jgi:hypothetical protein
MWKYLEAAKREQKNQIKKDQIKKRSAGKSYT